MDAAPARTAPSTCSPARGGALRAGAVLLGAALALGVGAGPAAAGSQSPLVRATAAKARVLAAGPPVLHIAPTASGKRDGSSWADAGDLSALPRFVASRPAGGQIWLRGDAGPYRSTRSVQLKTGGAAGHPVVIRGVDASGRPSRPVFSGTRVTPYTPGGSVGHTVFRLQRGVRHVVFSDLAFSSVGTAFVIGGDVEDVSISDMRATNVRFFLDNLKAKGEVGASARGLAVRRVEVAGFSKSAVRLRYDSTRILLEDVVADSQRQDRDRFAMGVALQGRASHVVLRRVTMANSHDTTSTYWNGDGFATEREVSDVLFEDTRATGSTDGGYDLKSTRTTLVRATAADNKRNFRFWADDTTVDGCTGQAPVQRGGSGSASHVWLGEGARVVMTGCQFVDGTARATAFNLESRTSLTVRDSTLTPTPGRRLSLLESQAQLVLPEGMR